MPAAIAPARAVPVNGPVAIVAAVPPAAPPDATTPVADCAMASGDNSIEAIPTQARIFFITDYPSLVNFLNAKIKMQDANKHHMDIIVEITRLKRYLIVTH